MSGVRVVPMTVGEHAAMLALWHSTPGVGVNERDEVVPLGEYLRRNPGMSQVAFVGSTLIGTLLAGHDGRRGYLHHLAVAASHRRLGVAKALLAAARSALAAAGIDICHCFVYPDNHDGQAFWIASGWRRRHDLMVMTSGGTAPRR
jgi:N-acetylglutamate synthase